jgi:CDP-diacylglycerol--glycerol-3-phosphate 3-phosphatidyltransferase
VTVHTPNDAQVSNRVLTLPNALSLFRLLGVPVFLWLILGPEADLLAVAVLMLSGFSDWLDGRLARAWGQISRVGQLLDPIADRLYIVAIVAAFLIRDIIPWWLAAILVGRDVVLALTLPVLRHYGYGPLPVHFLGKAATFNLLVGFPLLLLSQVDGFAAVAPFAWAFTIWGSALYCWAGLLYLAQVATLIRADSREVPG